MTFGKAINNLVSRIRVFSNWYSVEIMYIGLRKPGACRVKTWQGLKIHVRNLNDLNILDGIFASRNYDQKPCRIPPNKVILDIGAHIGAFSLYAASICKARRVFSCEPCPENFALLKENVESNELSNVITPIALAVGATKETRTFYLSESNDSHSFYCKGKPIKVQCTTLKQLLDDNNINKVDFLKMNCEGGEYEILQSVDESTVNRIDIIGMAFHNHPRDWFISRLQALGFSMIETRERKYNERARYILAKKV